MTSAGRSFTFDHSLGCWLCLTDACGSIQQSSSYATCNTTGNNLNKSAQNDNLPLASLMYLTPNQTPRLQNNVPAETKALANVTHCRNLRLAAEYLNSPKEYQYWLLAEIKQMATNGDVDGKCFFDRDFTSWSKELLFFQFATFFPYSFWTFISLFYLDFYSF